MVLYSMVRFITIELYKKPEPCKAEVRYRRYFLTALLKPGDSNIPTVFVVLYLYYICTIFVL